MKNNNELIPTGGTTENFESVVKENKPNVDVNSAIKNYNTIIDHLNETTDGYEYVLIQPLKKVKKSTYKGQTMTEKIKDKLMSLLISILAVLFFIILFAVGSSLGQQLTEKRNQTQLEQIYKAGYVRGYNKALKNDTTTFEYQYNKYIQKK